MSNAKWQKCKYKCFYTYAPQTEEQKTSKTQNLKLNLCFEKLEQIDRPNRAAGPVRRAFNPSVVVKREAKPEGEALY